MAVKVTPDPALGTAYGVATHQMRGTKFIGGYINCSGITYATGGVTCTFPVTNLWHVSIEPRLASASMYMIGYDKTNTLMTIFNFVGPSTTSRVCVGAQLASDTDLSSWTATYFFVIGRD